MNGQPHMQETQKDDSWATNSVKRNAVDDLVSILFSKTSVALEVAKAIEELSQEIGIVVC